MTKRCFWKTMGKVKTMGNVLDWLWLLCFLLPYVTGESNVTGSRPPVVGLTGHDVILPCHLEPPSDASGLTIKWTKLNSILELVHLRRNGIDSRSRSKFYKNRTALFTGEQKNGNVSLRLSGVGISDAGTYRCRVISSNGLVKEAEIELKIEDVSNPQVSLMEHVECGVVLECASGGWYPEPEVEWLDSEGRVLPASKKVFNPTSRYNVTAKITLAGKGRYTCRVVQPDINQTRERDIDVTDEDFQSSSSGCDVNNDVLIFVLIAVFIAVLLIAVLIRCTRCGRVARESLCRWIKAHFKTPIPDLEANLLSSVHVEKPNERPSGDTATTEPTHNAPSGTPG